MKKKILSVFLAFTMVAGLMSFAYASDIPEGVPSSVETATINKVEVQNDEDGVPYFQLEASFPQSFLDLSKECPAGGYTWIDYYWKTDDGSWEYLSGGTTECLFDDSYGFAVAGKPNTYLVTKLYPEDEGNAQEIVIKDHKYTIKMQLAYAYRADEDSPVSFVYSPFSNEVSIDSGNYYKKISDWAKPELQNAYGQGLIPDILIGADMTKPITREEFCELAVLLYEKVTGKASEPATPNPFTDTTNPQVLKAFKLGITTGTSADTFSPDVLINREQCAAMLFRAIKAIKPDGDYSVEGVKDFPDQNYISSWAVEATKYMSKIGIITGDANGNFMPKATTTAQEAAGYGMATREQAIVLSERTYEKIPSLS
ncbi:MAG: S-layer homology domain-containing protein [Bacillota bacterium]|nr:S-layer homology domain-containing protein [Bacillota bacterium]